MTTAEGLERLRLAVEAIDQEMTAIAVTTEATAKDVSDMKKKVDHIYDRETERERQEKVADDNLRSEALKKIRDAADDAKKAADALIRAGARSQETELVIGRPATDPGRAVTEALTDTWSKKTLRIATHPASLVGGGGLLITLLKEVIQWLAIHWK